MASNMNAASPASDTHDSAPIAEKLIARAHLDQVEMLYGQWHRTTISMLLGASILCIVLWGQAEPLLMLLWLGAICVNQAWRGVLAHAFRLAKPGVEDAPRWGTYWSIGSAVAGALWGLAAVVMYPTSTAHEALLIVCLFGVALGGLNLTAVYKPSFYGFTLCALPPLIVRVALAGDTVHLFTALVMGVVLVFLLGFGHHLNHVLTHSLAIRYANVDLIHELRQQTREAEQARTAAETANLAKSQFLAAASHDLRQPLHALGLFAAALAARAREPELRPLIASIHASVDALESLFAQLLDLSRLEAGALTPDRTDFKLQTLFERLADEFAPQAESHGLALSFQPTSIAIVSDPLLLERILRNLVSNALRYTRKGRVIVGARRQKTSVRIEVIDSGVGIPVQMRDRIFEEFVQGGASPQSHVGGRGMGLGLAIVRRLAKLLGHTLSLASVPGRGSRFSVTVQRAMPRKPRREIPPGTRLELSSVQAAFNDRSIAVIDDDPAIVAAMRALFETWGARVSGGENVAQIVSGLAVDSARNGKQGGHSPDLIVADLRLSSGACGLEAVAELRRLCGQGIPALIVSGDMSEEARTAVKAAGYTLLPKPLVADDLQEAAYVAITSQREAGGAAEGRSAMSAAEISGAWPCGDRIGAGSSR